MTLRRVARDLLAEPSPAWVVVTGREEAPPVVEVVTPSIDNLTDAADRLALVMPPPAEVRFTVLEGDGPVWLKAAAGVDLKLARHLRSSGQSTEPVAVDFVVLVDGEPAFESRVVTRPRGPQEEAAGAVDPHIWHHVGGKAGIPLRPGQEVTLRTSLPSGSAGGPSRVPAGFSGLVLERRIERPRTTASEAQPNLVWIVMDTERADRTTPYGYPRPTTPNLAQLASRGLLFEQAYATSSWTWPSTASLFTGRLPEGHGVVDFRSCYLADELETLAETLQSEGWTTGGFSGNPLVGPSRGFDQGFEHFEVTDQCEKGGAVVPPALAWLSQQREHRFFLYVHLHDPHTPHLPRKEDMDRFVPGPRYPPVLMQGRTYELRGSQAHTEDGRPRPELLVESEEARWYSDVYDACVATGDYWVGELLEQLEVWGLEDRTLVAYTSDHGEELLDHGMLNHNHDLWEELVRVPLVLAGPGIPSGETRSVPISNRHLAGTLAGHLGVDFPAPADSLDLLGELPERPIFMDTRHGWWKGRQFVEILGVRLDDWVLHWCPDGRDWGAVSSPVGGQWRCYDLASDPGQTRDLAHQEEERVVRMRELIVRQRQSLMADRPQRKRRAGAQTLSMLRAAGYAGGGEGPEDGD